MTIPRPAAICRPAPHPICQYSADDMRDMASSLTARGLTTHLTDARAGLDITAVQSPSGKREVELILDLCRPRDYVESFSCRLSLA